ncbi:hypothetical protein AB2L57_01075 [Microbacterium sp. HA-8]|uniref:hypothetical protein n=1 Tax=Microbacterium sp. HA-8 TaxID=3234200 RepID=UPI0038F74126
MSYVEHPIEHVPVNELHLDVTNYRFASAQPSESAAMNFLWAEQDVAEVARLILRDSYIDNEIPLVVREDDQWILLEGNRRVSALMALLKPSLAPAHQGEVEQLLKRFAIEAEALPSVIRVMVMPTREAAAPVLARLHIGQSKKAWNLDEQAKFVLAQLTSGTTLEQLKAQLPAIKDIPRVVRMGRVRERLRTSRFNDPDISAYVNGPRLAMSSFEYAYRNPTIQKLIGLEFDAQARVVQWAQSPAELVALERLVRGFRDGELNTRRGLKPDTEGYEDLLIEMKGGILSPATTDSAPEYLSDPQTPESPASAPEESERSDPDEDVPDHPTAQTPAPDPDNPASSPGLPPSEPAGPPDPGEPAASPTEPDAPNTPRGPNDPETKLNLSTAGIDEGLIPIPFQHRLRELRRINVIEFPAAAAMLMRSVVEASIKEHYGLGNGIEATGTLGDVMGRVTADYGSNGQLANAISSVNRTRKNASDIPGTGQWFNLVAHSVNVDAQGKHIHQAWRVVYPLVRFMLTESPRPPK